MEQGRLVARSLPLFLFGLLLLESPSAHADRSFDVALGAPAIDPYGFTIVDRAKTPQRFEFGMQAQFGWAHNPFHPTLDNAMLVAGRADIIQQQLTVDLGFYFGLWDFLSIAAVMPMAVHIYDLDIVGQSIIPQQPSAMNPTGFPGTSGLYRGQPRQTLDIGKAGPRDPRLALKARFYGGQYFELGSILEVTLPIGDQNSFMGEKNATFRPRLLAGLLLGRFNAGLSFGAIVRESAELYDPYLANTLRFQLSHELTWGVGLSLLLHQLVSLGVEGFGTIPIAGDAVSATANLLGSVSIRPTEKLRFSIAGGGGLIPDNPRNADGRILISAAYSLSPHEGGLR